MMALEKSRGLTAMAARQLEQPFARFSTDDLMVSWLSLRVSYELLVTYSPVTRK